MELEKELALIQALGLPLERAEVVRKEVLERVFAPERTGDDEALRRDGCMLQIDDPSYVAETYVLEREGMDLCLTGGDIDLPGGGHSEFCILMCSLGDPEDVSRCRDFQVVYSRYMDREPDVSLERGNVEVAILKVLCRDGGYRLTSTTTGLMPIELPRELVADRTRRFYEDLLLNSKEALDRDPLDGDAWRRRSSALYFRGELDGAEEALHRSLVLNPTVSWPFTALGYIHLYRGNVGLARWLFKQGQEAFSRLPLVRDPLAILDIVHPRGRLEDGPGQGRWRFDGDVCPECGGEGAWGTEDGVRGSCSNCGHEMVRREVEMRFGVLPTRCFYIVGEPVELEIFIENTIGRAVEVMSEGVVEVSTLDRRGRRVTEDIELLSALGQEVVPARSRGGVTLDLGEAVPEDSPLWRELGRRNVLDVCGVFLGRVKDPPTERYRKVLVVGLAEVRSAQVLRKSGA